MTGRAWRRVRSNGVGRPRRGRGRRASVARGPGVRRRCLQRMRHRRGRTGDCRFDSRRRGRASVRARACDADCGRSGKRTSMACSPRGLRGARRAEQQSRCVPAESPARRRFSEHGVRRGKETAPSARTVKIGEVDAMAHLRALRASPHRNRLRKSRPRRTSAHRRLQPRSR